MKTYQRELTIIIIYSLIWKIKLKLFLMNLEKKYIKIQIKRKGVLMRNKQDLRKIILILNNYFKKLLIFYNMSNYTTSTCATKINIEIIIDWDDLVKLLQETSPFKLIESEQCGNVFCVKFD